MATQSKNTVGKAAAGLAALAAAAAATYYFAVDGKAAQHRRKMGAWASKAKREVVSEIKRLEKVSRPAYEAAIAAVLSRYQQGKKIGAEEVGELAKELKSQWSKISQALPSSIKATAKAKRPARTKAKSKK